MSGAHGAAAPSSSVVAAGVFSSPSQLDTQTGMISCSPCQRNARTVPASVELTGIVTDSVLIPMSPTVSARLSGSPESGTPRTADWCIDCGDSTPSSAVSGMIGSCGSRERPSGGVYPSR